MEKKNLKQVAESTKENLQQFAESAKRKIKQTAERVSDGLRNMKNSTKIRLSAGLMSGLMLTSGIAGCARTSVDENKDKVDTNGVKVEDTVKPGEIESGVEITETEAGTFEVETYPVIDQSVLEQFEIVHQQMVEVLKKQGVADEKINKLNAKIAKCTTEEQMQEAIDSMRVAIQNYIRAEIDKKLSEMEQANPEQGDNSEIEFGAAVDLDEMLSILQQMNFDMNLGVRTDYHEMFIEAERFDQILKSIDKSMLDESKLEEVERAIFYIQEGSVNLQFYYAIQQTKSDTGCFVVNIEGDESVDETANGFYAIDEKGKMVLVGRDREDKETSVAVFEGGNGTYWDVMGEGVGQEDIDARMQEYVYRGSWLADNMLNSYYNPGEADWGYSVIDGYSRSTSQEVRYDEIMKIFTKVQI